MKRYNLLLVLFALILFQCNSPKEKFNKGEYSSNCPIKDLITEVPALDENSIVPVVLEDSVVTYEKPVVVELELENKKSGFLPVNRSQGPAIKKLYLINKYFHNVHL